MMLSYNRFALFPRMCSECNVIFGWNLIEDQTFGMEGLSIDILKKTFVRNVYLNSYQKLSKTQPRNKHVLK